MRSMSPSSSGAGSVDQSERVARTDAEIRVLKMFGTPSMTPSIIRSRTISSPLSMSSSRHSLNAAGR